MAIFVFPPVLTPTQGVSVTSHYTVNLISISSAAAEGGEVLSREAVPESHFTTLVQLIAIGDRKVCVGNFWSHHQTTDG